jgi:hypothetical protein
MKLLAILLLLSAPAWAGLKSPDGQLEVDLELDAQQRLHYRVQRAGQPVLLPSRLGLQLEGADLASSLRAVSRTAPRLHRERYELGHGKRRAVDYRANEQTYVYANPQGQRLELQLRVSNDGLAFRYRVAEPQLALKRFVSEASSFRFAPEARAWLQPMSVAETGWSRVNPAYEEHYQTDIAVGTASPSKAGWVFPALFRTGETWVALSEAGMDGGFHASRLQAESPNGEYQLGQPMAPERFPGGTLLAEVKGTLTSPWRVLAIGSLKTVMESTLGTDLAAPAIRFDARKVQPGHAAWSWAILKDDATTYELQKQFIDYAADMHWDHVLIDADWDRKIGDAKLKQLVDYARGKRIAIHVWYNSSGPWNDTEYTPKSKLLTPAQRRSEFARMQQLGVAGLKIDFFNGDGQSVIGYYLDLLKDAAAHGLLVNFHGATLPRGWSRTFPNFMTAEGVKGFEFATFEQVDQDKVARHLAMLPFARNLWDPMDFTPMVFGDIPKIQRRTRNGFELAQSVLLLSGIQHFAETPEGMATVPAAVKDFLRALPRRWDETRFLAGEPGRYLVLARRAGKAWYVAGFNADEAPRELKLDLGFLGERQGELIGDGEGMRDFSFQTLPANNAAITLKPQGGFVAEFR